MDDLSRQVELICPTCGCTQFVSEELPVGQEYTDDWEFICAHCGHRFTRKQLIEENTETINAHIENMGNEIVAEMAKDLKKQLKKSGWTVK